MDSSKVLDFVSYNPLTREYSEGDSSTNEITTTEVLDPIVYNTKDSEISIYLSKESNPLMEDYETIYNILEECNMEEEELYPEGHYTLNCPCGTVNYYSRYILNGYVNKGKKSLRCEDCSEVVGWIKKCKQSDCAWNFYLSRYSKNRKN